MLCEASSLNAKDIDDDPSRLKESVRSAPKRTRNTGPTGPSPLRPLLERAGSRIRLLEQPGEVPEFGKAEVRDDPIAVIRRSPVQQVIALAGEDRGSGGRVPPGGSPGRGD